MGDERYHAAQVQVGKVIVGRLLPGSDLIRGLEAVCDEYGIHYAAVVSAYGSLSSAAFKILRSSGSKRPSLVMKQVTEPVEFLGGQGLVCGDGSGGRETHLHASIADATGHVEGGHFVPAENPVYNNLEFTLVELHGIELTRIYDKETDTVEVTVSTPE